MSAKQGTVVDARGLSCPQPALLARQTITSLTKGVVEVLVDAATQRDNVTRVAQKEGWSCTTQATADGGFRLVLKK